MKFYEISRDINHHGAALDRARDASKREWTYRTHTDGEYDADGHTIRPYDYGLVVHVGVIAVPGDVRVDMRVTGYGWNELNAGKMTIGDLHCVIEAKRVVDLWVNGEIAALPIEPPRPAY